MRVQLSRSGSARRGLRAAVTSIAVGALAVTASLAAAAPALAGAGPAAVGAPPAGAATAPAAAQTAAGYGAGWLAGQLSSTGYLVGFSGKPDLSDTAYAVLGLHAAGVGKAAADKATSYLAANAAAAAGNPGQLAYLIMAAVAAGQDPRSFGGVDLVAALESTQRTSGADAGLFGSSDPSYDGASRQGLALAGLRAAGVPVADPHVRYGSTWLVRQQCADGLWTSYRADPSKPCPAADPTAFSGPDTNSTGFAVQGLAAYGAHPNRAARLVSLKAVQSADGGFPNFAARGQASDPNSTALVIETILADGGNPAAAPWATGTKTPYTALASYQLGCRDPAANRGALYFPGSGGRDPSVLATVQAVPALAAQVLPLPASTPAATVPTVPCGGVSGQQGVGTPTGAVGPTGRSLPFTGPVPVGGLALVALGLLVTGGVLLGGVRRGSDRA